MVCKMRTLKEAVAPIIWLNRIFCMGIFEIPVNRPRFLPSFIYAVLMMIGYFFMLYRGIVIFQRKSTSFNYLFYFVLMINILVATLAIILFWRKSENISNIIKKCSMADVTLEALGIKRKYQKIFHHNIGLIISWIAGMILLITMHTIWIYRDVNIIEIFYINTCFCIPLMTNSVVDATFTIILMCIQTKFQSTNILLNKVIQCTNESNIFKMHLSNGPDEHDETSIQAIRAQYKNNKDRRYLLQTLRHLHLEITKIARKINATYCFQLLLELMVHFTIVTACAYNIYIIFSGHKKISISDEKIIAMFIWICVYSFKIIFINNLCAKISEEAYRTGEIVQSFEGCYLDDDLREEIRQFTQQVMLNSLNFTAAGFFTIDNNLTGKFFATVTTYVVILIQMNTPLI